MSAACRSYSGWVQLERQLTTTISGHVNGEVGTLTWKHTQSCYDLPAYNVELKCDSLSYGGVTLVLVLALAFNPVLGFRLGLNLFGKN